MCRKEAFPLPEVSAGESPLSGLSPRRARRPDRRDDGPPSLSLVQCCELQQLCLTAAGVLKEFGGGGQEEGERTGEVAGSGGPGRRAS